MDNNAETSNNKDKIKYKCKECIKVFGTKTSLSKHEKNTHKKQVEVTCPICPNIVFSNRKEYHEHCGDLHKTKNSGNYLCKECGKEYKMRRTLMLHARWKCGKLNLHKCRVCSKELKTAASLHNHTLRHNGTPSFMCRFCAKLFITLGQLEIHERVHTQDKPFICDICNKSFSHRQSLVTHSTLHTGIKPFSCESCLRSFSCIGNILKHRKTHAECAKVPSTTHTIQNSVTKRKLQANTPRNCKVKCILKEKIRAEKEKSANEAAKEITVKVNTVITKITKEISIAKLDHLENENQTLKECSSTSANNISNRQDADTVKVEITCTAPNDITLLKENNECLEQSIDEVHNVQNTYFEENSLTPPEDNETNIFATNISVSDNPPEIPNNQSTTATEFKDISKNTYFISYICNSCKKYFPSKKECDEHQKKEHSELLKCTICDKVFSAERTFKIHQKTFHQGVPRRSYKYICPRCGKQFYHKTSLATHEKNKCQNSKFECEQCNKSFTTAYYLKTHKTVHGTKKFLCNYCGKSFHWKAQMKIHERSHTGDKPFSCLYCPKTFAYRQSLLTHSTIHTGVKHYICNACGSRFSCVGNLIKHRASHAKTCGVYLKKTSTIVENVQNI